MCNILRIFFYLVVLYWTVSWLRIVFKLIAAVCSTIAQVKFPLRAIEVYLIILFCNSTWLTAFSLLSG